MDSDNTPDRPHGPRRDGSRPSIRSFTSSEKASRFSPERPVAKKSAPTPTPAEIVKMKEVLEACRWKDLGGLRAMAETPGGFLSDSLRRIAWPLLLGVPPPPTPNVEEIMSSGLQTPSPPVEGQSAENGGDYGDWQELPRHEDEDQVQLDVNRSFIYYPNDESDAQLKQRKSELSNLISEVLRRHSYLRYFQGFHDICQVFLLILSPSQRAPAVARLCGLRIRDFMLHNLGPTTAQLRLLPDIIARADPKLRRHLAGVEPFYALAGTLTMYAHNIETLHEIARLFDVILAREPAFSVYLFAQIVLDRRSEIFEIDEPDMLHVILGKVPPQMDLDALIARTAELLDRHPPESLPAWSRISSASVLKTGRDLDACANQTMDQAHDFFEQQARELRWAETQERMRWTLWAYRRPVGAFGVALAAGVLAMYFRRNPSVLHVFSVL